MLLWGLQRYCLSPDTPRDAAVGFTKVLPLPTHPKGCCCGVYRGTTSPPHTPRDAAVGFTKVLPLPTHPKVWCCGVYKGTTCPAPHTPYTPRDAVYKGTASPHTPQGMLLWGLQRYYLSPHTPHTPRDVAVGFTKVLPLPTHPTHPKGCCCGVYKGTTSPHTPVHPKGCCCGVYKGTTSPQTPRSASDDVPSAWTRKVSATPPLHTQTFTHLSDLQVLALSHCRRSTFLSAKQESKGRVFVGTSNHRKLVDYYCKM